MRVHAAILASGSFCCVHRSPSLAAAPPSALSSAPAANHSTKLCWQLATASLNRPSRVILRARAQRQFAAVETDVADHAAFPRLVRIVGGGERGRRGDLT